VEGYEMDILEGAYKPFVCIKQKSLLNFGHGMWKKSRLWLAALDIRRSSLFTHSTYFRSLD
jgi:hypothetical protein